MPEGSISIEEAKSAPPVEASKKQDVVEKLMPKVEQAFNKDGTIDEAKMLKLMDELEKTGELKDGIHTLGEGKDRAIILRNSVQKGTAGISYGPAENPRELIPIGTTSTNQSEWLAMNRKGFLKYVVVNEQTLKIDETSAYFDGRRFPDSHWRDYEGPIIPDQHYITQIRTWANGVERDVKWFGDKNRRMIGELLRQSDYPKEPSDNPFNRYRDRPPQPEVDKYYFERDLSAFGRHFNPESGWTRLEPTEEERKASRALRRGDNPAGWELNQWHNEIFRVDSPKLVGEALKANAKPTEIPQPQFPQA